MKRCRKCREWKEKADYYKDRSRKDGLTPYCKPCRYTPVTERKLSPTLLCNVCKVRKPRDEFYGVKKKDKRCKDCTKERNKNRKRNCGKEANARKSNKRRGAGGERWHYTVVKFQSDVCVKCGAEGPLQFDHIVPIALGGKTESGNLQMLCQPCNGSKGATIADHRKRVEEHEEFYRFIV